MWNKRAVTLIELLLVLAIFGVIGGIIFPLFIQSLRLQSTLIEDVTELTAKRHWMDFSREFRNAIRSFSEPVIEVEDTVLHISEGDDQLTLTWFKDNTSLEMEIFPSFYKQPYSRRFRFPENAAFSWEYEYDELRVSLQKDELDKHIQVPF